MILWPVMDEGYYQVLPRACQSSDFSSRARPPRAPPALCGVGENVSPGRWNGPRRASPPAKLWPAMDQGSSQVLPRACESSDFSSRARSPRALPALCVAAENCQSRPEEPVKACASDRQTLASDGPRTAKGGTVEPGQFTILVLAHGLPARRALARIARRLGV